MNKTLSTIAVAAAIGCASINAEAQTIIGKTTDVAAISKGDRMTPETLWAMGRIGGAAASPDGTNCCADIPERIASANFGPTPLVLINSLNNVRSCLLLKPYSSCASSRTTKWVKTIAS